MLFLRRLNYADSSATKKKIDEACAKLICLIVILQHDDESDLPKIILNLPARCTYAYSKESC